MKKYFARLTPAERRFVVVVALLFFIVLNLFWVWPHFSDWGILKNRLRGARAKLQEYERVIQQADRLRAELAKMESEGMEVPAEDQAIEFVRTIQMQAQQSGVGIMSFGHQTTQTNQFFNEKAQTISGVSDEKQLVDFLYKLGAGNSLIRVRAISVRPDQSRQRLNSNITLVASYQKNRPAATAPAAPRPGAPSQPAPAVQKPSPAGQRAPTAVKAPTPTIKPPTPTIKTSPPPARGFNLKPATPTKR